MSEVAIINEDLFKDFALLAEKLTTKLNEQPDPKWLQRTPDNKAQYIPIGIIENQLRQDFFGLVQYEVLNERRELNEYICSARIKVFHPVIKQWLSYDGIGAVQIMQDSGATISQFNDTKKKNALQMNAPKAYAEAIKNAAKKIGVKYGANVNRNFEESYEPELTISITLEEVLPLLDKCTSTDDLKMLWDTYPELQTSNKFKMAFSQRKLKIK